MEGKKGKFYTKVHALSMFYAMSELERVKLAIINAANQGCFWIHWKSDEIDLEAATREFLQNEGFKVIQKTKWRILIKWESEEKDE